MRYENKYTSKPSSLISNTNTKIFQTVDQKIQIFIGDFFDMTPEILGKKADCVFDRGSLVAIDKELRERLAILTTFTPFSFFFKHLFCSLPQIRHRPTGPSPR